jgi:hypothetical protein
MVYYSLTIRKSVPVKTVKSLHACMKVYRTYIKKLRAEYKDGHLDIHYEYVDKINGSVNVHVHMMLTTNKKIIIENVGSQHETRGSDCRLPRLPKAYYLDASEVVNTFAWKAYIEKSNLTEMEIIRHCEDKFNHIPITPMKRAKKLPERSEEVLVSPGKGTEEYIEDEETERLLKYIKEKKVCLFSKK